MLLDNKAFALVSLEEGSPGWITYALQGSNGNPISGGMAGTVEEVREALQLQLTRANKRRLTRQHWVYWNWGPAAAPAT
jgi:hypothetical protein